MRAPTNGTDPVVPMLSTTGLAGGDVAPDGRFAPAAVVRQHAKLAGGSALHEIPPNGQGIAVQIPRPDAGL